MTRISPNIKILPCLNTNYTYHISAKLHNGDIITGQSQISHPNEPISTILSSSTSIHQIYDPVIIHEDIPYQHPDLNVSQLHFSKNENQPLKSPIDKIFYINPYGEEIHPQANSRTIHNIHDSQTLIYSIGSLMTSTIPVIILKGIGMAIKNSSANKILLLNGDYDRETFGLTALDFIKTLCGAVKYSIDDDKVSLDYYEVVTHLIYMENSEIPVDVEKISNLGIKCISVPKDEKLNENINIYDLSSLQNSLKTLIH